MKIERFARFFSAQSDSASTNNNSKKIAGEAKGGSTPSEAVKVSAGFGLDSKVGDAGSRAERVASIKSAVANGTYSPDSRAVAAAVYKELIL